MTDTNPHAPSHIQPGSVTPSAVDTRWTPVDPLGEALHFLHMSGVYYTHSVLTAPWGLAVPALPDSLMFHVVTSGACWLEVTGAEPQLLQPGDFSLVPHGDGHRLLSELGTKAVNILELPLERISERYERLQHGHGGAETTLICGGVRFDHPAAQHLVHLLPQILCVRAWDAPQMAWMQSTLRLMALEAQNLQPGGETIITRLADILVVQAIRTWLVADPVAQTGWLGALQDKQIGRAILLIQRYPAEAWTVASLAEAVSMSRSAFAARFKDLVGETPMHYATRWKMNLAVQWLQEQNLTLMQLADRLGYQSEAAFSRAFKRFIGVSPGAVRRGEQASNPGHAGYSVG
jgi:AraC-like DNA-binding protein